LRAVYAPFAGTPVVETNNSTAEAIKYASNAVLATMISFSNEIGNLCSTLRGVDVAHVMQGVHLARYFTTPLDDGRRIKAGIASFLWAGCGYGGSCLPKDTQALSAHGRQRGAPMPLLDAVIATNLAQPAKMIGLLDPHFASLEGVRVTVLGLAFKEGTDDMRESPAIPIVRMLIERGATVTGFDPAATDSARAVLPSAVRFAASLEAALSDAQVVLLVTRWDEFARVPELLAQLPSPPLLVDGRRVLEPASVPRYAGIGRSSTLEEKG
jgi:UDPglucose 6-dehydrogenase